MVFVQFIQKNCKMRPNFTAAERILTEAENSRQKKNRVKI